MTNVRNSAIHIPRIYGFKYGFVPRGDNQGFAYNEVYLGRLSNNQRQIQFRYAGRPLGYVNENTFHGGKIELVSGSSEDGIGEYIGIEMPAIGGELNAGPNRNVFIRPCLEGTYKAPTARSVLCDGQENTFLSPRLEGNPDGAFELGPLSRVNQVLFGERSAVDPVFADLGANNTIRGFDGVVHGTPSNVNQAVIGAKNGLGLDDRPAIGAYPAGGDCATVALTGAGQVLWPASGRLQVERQLEWSGTDPYERLELTGGTAGTDFSFVRSDGWVSRPIEAQHAQPLTLFIDLVDHQMKYKSTANEATVISTGDGSTLVVQGSTIEISGYFHRVHAGGRAGVVTSVLGGGRGGRLVLAAAPGQSITLEDDTGNLRLAGDCTLTGDDSVQLIHDSNGSVWIELSRSDN